MKIVLLNIAAAVLLALSISSCSKAAKVDQKAIEACAVKDKANKAFEDGEACKECCGKAGASGHMWMLGDGCKCL